MHVIKLSYITFLWRCYFMHAQNMIITQELN